MTMATSREPVELRGASLEDELYLVYMMNDNQSGIMEFVYFEKYFIDIINLYSINDISGDNLRTLYKHIKTIIKSGNSPKDNHLPPMTANRIRCIILLAFIAALDSMGWNRLINLFKDIISKEKLIDSWGDELKNILHYYQLSRLDHDLEYAREDIRNHPFKLYHWELVTNKLFEQFK